jgi:hypothetical protein
VLSAAYSTDEGKVVILANSNRTETECTIVFNEVTKVEIKTANSILEAEGRRIKVKVPALDAALVKIK